MIKDKLIGTWRLKVCTTVDEKGNEENFFGENPRGVIMYDECGNMAVQLCPLERPEFVNTDFNDFTGDEAKGILMTYQAYYGKYKVNEEEGFVLHIVDDGVRPNWRGFEETRYYKFEEDFLILTSPPVLANGKNLIFVAKWKKEKALD